MKLGDAFTVVTERRADGSLVWDFNPKHVETRKALARVLGVVEGLEQSVTFGELRQVFLCTSRDQAARMSQGVSPRPAASRDYAHNIYSIALPGCWKAWDFFTSAQRRAAERLGVDCEEAWNGFTAPVFQQAWWDLSEAQRCAAGALGFNEQSWAQVTTSTSAADNKEWAELTEVQRAAAAQLHIVDKVAWEKVSKEGQHQVLGSMWERAWDDLSEDEREAVRQLDADMGSSDDWDQAAWNPGDAWKRSWEDLSRREVKAAKKLGITGSGLWKKVSGDALGLAYGSITWDGLSPGQRSAAGRLAYDRACWSPAA